ncbi:MAG: hypothetical protein BGO67_07505 [Alphaproteobacteria bacterium 41-28]|nr:MAG: hypothetical protein BGO67_07505 [Alphaproteobacteria bacterium 41-28]
MSRFLYMALIIGALGSFSQANACFFQMNSLYCGDAMYGGYPMYSGYSVYNGYPMFSGFPMYSEFPFYSGVMMGGVSFPMFDGISSPIPVYMIDQYDVALRHPESSVIGY